MMIDAGAKAMGLLMWNAMSLGVTAKELAACYRYLPGAIRTVDEDATTRNILNVQEWLLATYR